MQEQIKALAERFGLKTDQVEAGLGAVLQFIQSRVPAQQWSQLSGLIPQAQALMGKAAGLPAAAKASAVPGRLQQAGVKPEAMPQFAAAVIGQIKAKASPEQFKALVAQVPGLDQLATSAGGLLGKLRGMG